MAVCGLENIAVIYEVSSKKKNILRPDLIIETQGVVVTYSFVLKVATISRYF